MAFEHEESTEEKFVSDEEHAGRVKDHKDEVNT